MTVNTSEVGMATANMEMVHKYHFKNTITKIAKIIADHFGKPRQACQEIYKLLVLNNLVVQQYFKLYYKQKT
jgi:hypothetical protein